MFGLTYLPEKDLKRQLELQDELMNCRDLKRVEVIRQELQKLEAKRKPIIECNLEETTELKTILHKKLDMVSRVGKRTQAVHFAKMIKMLDDRILVLNLEMRKEEKEKSEKAAKAKEERINEAREAREVRSGIETGKRPTKRRTGASRWTTGFSKDD